LGDALILADPIEQGLRSGVPRDKCTWRTEGVTPLWADSEPAA